MTGFFGKVPTKGDFVTRNLPSQVSETLLAFFTDGMDKARSTLNQNWLEYYSTAPIWYFYLSPGVTSEEAYIGSWMVSVDSVDRHFPFIALAQLPSRLNTMADIGEYTEWLHHLEHHMLDILEPDLDIDGSLTAIQDLAISANTNPNSSVETLLEESSEGDIEQFSEFEKAVLKKLESLERSVQKINTFLSKTPTHTERENARPEIGSLTFDQNLAHYAPQFSNFVLPSDKQHSLWLTKGNKTIPPTAVLCEAIPPPASFLKFITGFSHG